MDINLNRLHNNWLEDNRDNPKSITECDECGRDIFSYEDHYVIEGYSVCEDCLNDFTSKRYLVRGES
ncbi:MAG: hypothetical protein RR912_04350 [Clostridium sp.]